MRYSIPKGLVHESVCGQELLIATLEARKSCPYLIQMNDSLVFVWRMLEKGMDVEQMCFEISKEFEITEDLAKKTLSKLLIDLEQHNIIIKVQEKDDHIGGGSET